MTQEEFNKQLSRRFGHEHIWSEYDKDERAFVVYERNYFGRRKILTLCYPETKQPVRELYPFCLWEVLKFVRGRDNSAVWRRLRSQTSDFNTAQKRWVDDIKGRKAKELSPEEKAEVNKELSLV